VSFYILHGLIYLYISFIFLNSFIHAFPLICLHIYASKNSQASPAGIFLPYWTRLLWKCCHVCSHTFLVKGNIAVCKVDIVPLWGSSAAQRRASNVAVWHMWKPAFGKITGLNAAQMLSLLNFVADGDTTQTVVKRDFLTKRLSVHRKECLHFSLEFKHVLLVTTLSKMQ